jgi:hypothetical protein
VTPDNFHVFSRSCGPDAIIGVRETVTWSPTFVRDWFWTVSHHYGQTSSGLYIYLHSINTYEKIQKPEDGSTRGDPMLGIMKAASITFKAITGD